MRKKIKTWKKVMVGTAITATLGLGFWASKAFYEVKEVIDGDTFVTKENRYIRLDPNIDAPEINSCLWKESREELKKLVLGKKVFVKAIYVDDHKRLTGSVYTNEGNVGAALLKTGLAAYDNKRGTDKVLLEASRVARVDKIGVYSPTCTQSENTKNSRCNIKGNNSEVGKHYSYPGCTSYSETLVQLHMDDGWYCTEKEALSAGFTKSGDCPK